MIRYLAKNTLAVMALASVISGVARANDSQELAKQLANPLAALISVPFQGNYNSGIRVQVGRRV